MRSPDDTPRRTAVVLLLLLFGTQLVAGAGPAAASHEDRLWPNTRWVLKTRPTTVVRDGEQYRLRITVRESVIKEEYENSTTTYREESAVVTMWSRSNPQGVAKAVQTHDYDYLINEDFGNHFRHSSTLEDATVRGGDPRSDEMRLRLAFDAETPGTRGCNGHITRRSGAITGSFEFHSVRGDIGSVTKVPTRAVLTHHDGQCPNETFRRCSGDGLGAYAYRDGDRDMRVEATVLDGQDTATVTVYHRRWSRSSAHHEIRAVVPRSRVRIAPDLSSVTIRGLAGTYLRGRLHATATLPEQPRSGSQCGRDEECADAYTMRGTNAYTGDFVADFWIGADRRAASGPLEGNLRRYQTLP